MTATANGWRVISRAECIDVEIPGGEIPIHPEFAWLAQDLAIRWHETVEPLAWPGCWGWAEPRPIRGEGVGAPISNHCSGTAWDLSAPKHPRGVPISKTFTRAQLLAVSALETRYFGVLRWGGRWTGSDVDGMHWEGQPGVSVEAVRALTAALQGAPPAPAAPPAPTPSPRPAQAGTDLTGTGLALRGDQGNAGPRVARLQAFLLRNYPRYAREGLGPAGADGVWGPRTTAVLRTFAVNSGIRTADGANIGPQIARKLYLAGARP